MPQLDFYLLSQKYKKEFAQYIYTVMKNCIKFLCFVTIGMHYNDACGNGFEKSVLFRNGIKSTFIILLATACILPSYYANHTFYFLLINQLIMHTAYTHDAQKYIADSELYVK